MRRNCLLIMVICVIAFVVFGCKSSNDDVKKKISMMQSQFVNIPFDKMSCWINDTLLTTSIWEHADMKLVVYIDSTQCSKCALKQMYLWDDFVNLEKKFNNRFKIFFIMQTHSGNTQALASTFYLTQLNHPIFIDSTGVFAKNNPQIPQEKMYHVFLLDEKNNVVLVGNPLYNPKIEEILIAILEKKLNKNSSCN